jgi:biofilm PGA synthesis lipoprotein PgaB
VAKIARVALAAAGLVLLMHAAVASDRGLPRISPKATGYSAVLMWHDIVPGKKDVWFDVTVAEFRRQLTEIKRRGFHVIPLEQLQKHLVDGSPVPPKSLVLTFDDNTEGLYRYAYPMLKEFGFPATYYVHTSFVGVRTCKEHCTWGQLAEMARSGLISVQSHTCTHPPNLRVLSDADLRRELTESRARIEKRLGTRVFALAYTEGNFDRRVQEAVRSAGYTNAVGEEWGSAESSANLLAVHRYSVHRRFAQALNDVERAARRR